MSRNWDEKAAVAWVQEHIQIPVFTCDDFMMPYSVLGVVKVALEQGDWAANTALEILAGRNPADIPVVTNKETGVFVNESLAKRIHFDPGTLDFSPLKPEQ